MPTTDPDSLVDATAPDTDISLTGTDHITLTGSTVDKTIEFYRDFLGMPLVLSQPNLDRPHLHHLFFDTGDGRLITFFVSDDHEVPDTVESDVGQAHHISFRFELSEFDTITDALDEHDHSYSVYDRGPFFSIYTEDPNGLTIELAADKYSIPDDKRAEVIALAHKKRIEDDAEAVDDRHMEAAIDELNIDIKLKDGVDWQTFQTGRSTINN